MPRHSTRRLTDGAGIDVVVTDDPETVRAAAAEGAVRAADLALIGDEKTVAAGLRRYRDAGATEIVVTQSDLAGPAARSRTSRLLGELAR